MHFSENDSLAEIPSLRGTVSETEWRTRVHLAACYRLVAHHGWDDMLSTHISARLEDEPDVMLFNPYGLLFDQVTASCLVKVRISTGELLTSTPYLLNPAGINIHCGILDARPEIACAVHLHTTAGVAVSSLEEGLLPISQRACYFGPHNLAYHAYEGLAVEASERASLARDLGDKWAMFLRNHGTITLGRSIAQAFVATYFLEAACKTQIETLACNRPIHPLPRGIVELVPQQARHVAHWGKLEWPTLLALLDRVNPGYDR